MAYRSKVDIKLGQQPKSGNKEFYEDAIDLYNACHILNARMDAIQNGITSGEDDVPAWEAMPFTRWVWVTAYEDIAVGNVVTIVRGLYRNSDNTANIQVEGMVKGAPWSAGLNFSSPTMSGQGLDSIATGVVGICLDEVSAGGRARLGIGPAVIQVPEIKRGDLILAPTFVDSVRTTNPISPPFMQLDAYRGAMVRTWITQIPSVVIGSGIDNDAALILPQVDYYSQVLARAGLERSSGGSGPTTN